MSADPELERAAAEAEEEALEEQAGVPLTMSDLLARGDAEGLVALAKAYRSGTDGMEKDLKKSFECYSAAAKLGSAAAEYTVALFYLTGGIVEKDVKEAATRFRAAADGGYLLAKVYLANLYELGVYYKADSAKADVWYRNAARSAGLKSEPGTTDYRRAMAELGCVRYCLEIVRDGRSTADDKAAFLKKAKAFGYREGGGSDPGAPERLSAMPASVSTPTPAPVVARASEPSSPGLPSAAPSTDGTPAARPVTGTPAVRPATPDESVKQSETAVARADAVIEKAEKKAAKAKVKGPSLASRLEVDLGDGLTAFFFACVFMAAAFALGHGLTLGAKTLLEKGEAVPLVGPHVERILPIMLGALGVVPTLIVYRLPTFIRALVVAILAGIGAEVAWGASKIFIEPKLMQLLVFGAGGFLAALLVLGVFGGTRSGYKARHLKKIGVGTPLRIQEKL